MYALDIFNKNKNSFNLNKFFTVIKKKKKLLCLTECSLPEITIPPYNSCNYFLISYIIEISFSRTNTFFCVKTGCGDLITFCSAGSLIEKDKVKKTKVNRKLMLNKIISKLKELKFLKGKPISLHTVNVGAEKQKIVKELTDKFFVRSIQVFNAYPFNGCRDKKKRRKKVRKKRRRIKKQGEMAEWFKAADCKSVDSFIDVGSNPTLFIVL